MCAWQQLPGVPSIEMESWCLGEVWLAPVPPLGAVQSRYGPSSQDSSSQVWWLMDPPRSCPHGVEHSQFLSLFRMGCGFVPHRPGPCPWRPHPVARSELGAATGADGGLAASVPPHCLLSGKDRGQLCWRWIQGAPSMPSWAARTAVTQYRGLCLHSTRFLLVPELGV